MALLWRNTESSGSAEASINFLHTVITSSSVPGSASWNLVHRIRLFEWTECIYDRFIERPVRNVPDDDQDDDTLTSCSQEAGNRPSLVSIQVQPPHALLRKSVSTRADRRLRHCHARPTYRTHLRSRLFPSLAFGKRMLSSLRAPLSVRCRSLGNCPRARLISQGKCVYEDRTELSVSSAAMSLSLLAELSLRIKDNTIPTSP